MSIPAQLKISGSVLKASIAELGRMIDPGFDANYGQALSQMIIRTAIPSEISHSKTDRPEYPAFNLVVTSTNDQALVDYFTTCHENSIIFETNFKKPQRDLLNCRYPVVGLRYETRTRTAIRTDSFTMKEHHLFNYRSVIAKDRKWLFDAIIPEGTSEPTRQKIGDLIELIKSGWLQVGKTRADMAPVTSTEVGSPTGFEVSKDNSVMLKLQSPALLLSMSDISGLRDRTMSLKEAYVNYFRKILKPLESIIDFDPVRCSRPTQAGWWASDNPISQKSQRSLLPLFVDPSRQCVCVTSYRNGATGLRRFDSIAFTLRSRGTTNSSGLQGQLGKMPVSAAKWLWRGAYPVLSFYKTEIQTGNSMRKMEC